MNIPNALTLFRVFLVPVFILFFFSNIPNSMLWALLVFVLAGSTDMLDGYIARKYKLITDWGKVLDPFADKFMLITVLTCLVAKDYIPMWVLLVIVIKELFMVCFGALLYTRGTIIPSNIIGKFSTLCFNLSIVVFIFYEKFGIYLIYISVVTAVLALLNYSYIYFKNHKGSLKKN